MFYKLTKFVEDLLPKNPSLNIYRLSFTVQKLICLQSSNKAPEKI
jgi:hypothetical protein